MALIDFTLSNARQFYSSMGNPLGGKGLKELCNPDSKCRVVFATMALGMGVNIRSVREVTHISPPRSVREYFTIVVMCASPFVAVRIVI